MKEKLTRRNFLLGGAALVGAAGLGGFSFVHTAQFGHAPTGDRLARVKASPHYQNGQFQNLVPVPVMVEDPSLPRENRIVSTAKFLFGDKSALSPKSPLLTKKTDLFSLPRTQDAVVWMGHSSFYLQLAGRRILVDPVFGDYASPLFFINRAFAGSNVYQAADIPPLDALVLSHDHWDHLGYPTVMALKDKVAQVVCPLGVGEYFEQWGFDPAIIHDEDWGTEIPLYDNLKIYVLPSQHLSGRFLTPNPTLWAGFAFVTPTRKVYYTGDGGYGEHFKAIGAQFGGFDLVLAECGQYNLAWHYIHMLPEETAQAMVDVRAKNVLPVHNAKFALARHPWEEPLVRLKAASEDKPYHLLTPEIGTCVTLPATEEDFPAWWQAIG